MSSQVKNSISELLKESSQFNTNDVLVNVDVDNAKLIFSPASITFSITDFPRAILREAERTKKESGVNSLCIASGTVKLEVGGKDVDTPIILTPVQLSKNRIKGTITLEPIEDGVFVNPFLKMFLAEEPDFDCEINYLDSPPHSTSSVSGEEIVSGKDHLIGELQKIGLETKEVSILGNFHHHRYEIVKELEELLQLDKCSENVSNLLGEQSERKTKDLNFPPDLLFPADVDHEAVFEKAGIANTVIQGPPGTGKSQVLSNVLGKILAGNNTTVVVSEKRVALEVLQKKLSSFGLDKLCFIASSDRLSHSFLQELKSTWDYFESYKTVPVNNLRLSEQYEANLQMTLDLLAQKELIGGVSFNAFKSLVSQKDISQYSYSSNVPSITHFLEMKSSVEELYQNNLNLSVGSLKKRTIQSDDFATLDSKISTWIEDLKILKSDFSFTSWNEFSMLMKEAANCQVYENDLYKKYADIFRPNSRPQQRFLSLRKKYLKAKTEVDQISSNQSHWKIVPSESETLVLKETLENGGFFARLHSKKRWKEISNLQFQNALDALRKHLLDIAKINDLTQIIINFCEIGVDDPEKEIELIHQTLTIYSEDQWNEMQAIPSEKRSRITSHHKLLEKLYHDLQAHLSLTANSDLLQILNQLKTSFSEILSRKEQVQSLDENSLLTLSGNENFESFEGQILNSHWTRFKERFPAFSKFDMNEISNKVEDIIRSQSSEAKLFAQEIENKVSKAFSEYHELLSIPARKLTEEQKKLKARLRKGKSILVKEFAKTRSHPSLRELFNSEAREWIQLLKPIWLSNPAQLSKCFPLEESVFDVAIFDEASQIPLQNALGTIQRSDRILVAGDEHQMGPSSYFKSGRVELIDLLHQANYYWSKVELKHHYRSEHPELISFSNKHFYNGELKAFPAYPSTKATHHHYIENGQFIDRKNLEEAKAIAQTIDSALTKKGSIGIVAFSEEQLNCIWGELSNSAQQKLTDKIDNNEGFFKSLENVQGDECDHLFISFGYAKNEEGEFHMRFGPMNTINGRKRLNVLLTRAIKSIEFFCSMQSTDFKLSDNESINLLRQWMAFSESNTSEDELDLPFELSGKVEGNEIEFCQIQETLSNAKELVTLQSVMSNRGWKVRYS